MGWLTLISDDNGAEAEYWAQRLDLNHLNATASGRNKAACLQRMKKEGRFVCYIGDGLNDRNTMRSAHVSISLCGAATEGSAHLVFMNGSLKQLNQLFHCKDQSLESSTPVGKTVPV